MTLGTFLNLPGPSSLPLRNVDHNPCSASLRRLSGHQMKDCAWKYSARLMLTFQPIKCQWKKGWEPGLGLEVGAGGTPAHVTQTACHLEASATLLSHYRETTSNVNGFLWYPSHPLSLGKDNVPLVSSWSIYTKRVQTRFCVPRLSADFFTSHFPPSLLSFIYLVWLFFLTQHTSWPCDKTISM